jgi:hypothetical protein
VTTSGAPAQISAHSINGGRRPMIIRVLISRPSIAISSRSWRRLSWPTTGPLKPRNRGRRPTGLPHSERQSPRCLQKPRFPLESEVSWSVQNWEGSNGVCVTNRFSQITPAPPGRIIRTRAPCGRIIQNWLILVRRRVAVVSCWFLPGCLGNDGSIHLSGIKSLQSSRSGSRHCKPHSMSRGDEACPSVFRPC